MTQETITKDAHCDSEGAELPLAIEDYAVIGDCRTAALVGRNGSIDWLCWPRFDSDACMAALLGDADNGRWKLAPKAASRCERRYRPGTMVLDSDFLVPDGGKVTVTDFMPVGEDHSSIIRIVTGRKGVVDMQMELVLRFDYGTTVPWVEKLHEGGGIVAIAGAAMVTLHTEADLQGTDHRTEACFTVHEGQSVAFILTNSPSHLSPPQAIGAQAAARQTETYWRDWSDRCQYDGPYRDAVIRSLLTLKAMTFRETGGMVAAVTTSLPEQLGGSRNWDYRFCWLRDATIMLLAFMETGYYDEAANWREWLHRSVAGSPDQMQIMYGLSGERRISEWEVPWLAGYQGAKPVRIGNAASSQTQLDVYGEMMNALHLARQSKLADPKESWALQCAILEHLEQIWQKPDEGIWEIRGQAQHFTFSKIMCWVAFDRAIQDAEAFHLQAPVEKWKVLRAEIHDLVCQRGFSTALNSFTQVFDTENLDASLLLVGRLGFLPSNDPRVLGTIEAVEKDLLQDGFVMRYQNTSGVDGLEGTESAFLACSFWLASAFEASGQYEKAKDLFARLLDLRNDVGLLSEEYDPRTKRFTGNFPQAFSHVALVISALRFAGVNIASH